VSGYIVDRGRQCGWSTHSCPLKSRIAGQSVQFTFDAARMEGERFRPLTAAACCSGVYSMFHVCSRGEMVLVANATNAIDAKNGGRWCCLLSLQLDIAGNDRRSVETMKEMKSHTAVANSSYRDAIDGRRLDCYEG
jgi:hypothetical protein